MKFSSKFIIELENSIVAPVRFQLEYDNNLVDEKIVDRPKIQLQHEFDDAEGVSHCFRLIMTGKKGNNDIHQFISRIHRVNLDYIDITDFYSTVGLPYWHDGNGYQPLIQDRLHQTLGCDGSVEFYFSSPVYRWLPIITTPNYGY